LSSDLPPSPPPTTLFSHHEHPPVQHFPPSQPYPQRPLGALSPPHGGPPLQSGHPQTPCGPPPYPGDQPFPNEHRGGNGGRGGRRPTIIHVAIGFAAHEATSFDKESLNRSMQMIVPTMGLNTDFKQWKRNFLTFMSLKAASLIPQLDIRESRVWLDAVAQTYASALLLHAASENKRGDQEIKCISVARPHCATATWDILCERLDGGSFASSLSLLDNLMLRQRHEPVLRKLGACEFSIPTWPPLLPTRHRPLHTLHVGAVLEVQRRYMLGPQVHLAGDLPPACTPSLLVRHLRG
jgi:hypothetical protein